MAGFFLLSGCGMFFQKLKSKILIFRIRGTVGGEKTDFGIAHSRMILSSR